MGEWHAVLPVSSISSPVLSRTTKEGEHGSRSSSRERIEAMIEGRSDLGKSTDRRGHSCDIFAPNATSPSVWTVIHRWIDALPSGTEGEETRKDTLAKELRWVAGELGDMHGIDGKPFVFAHCDLLSGNVIVLPRSSNGLLSSSSQVAAAVPKDLEDEDVVDVGFIDYEYATAAPSAFDIANHFAEWGGFDCDFSVLPTRAQRRDFLQAYLRSYYEHLRGCGSSQLSGSDGNERGKTGEDLQEDLKQLSGQIDAFRGLPGFYWGIWALIQSMISQIDFDYASYAEIRLSEYWAWKAEWEGSREVTAEMPLRERRWQEE